LNDQTRAHIEGTRPIRAGRIALACALAGAAIAIAHLADLPVAERLNTPAPMHEDWGRMLRVFGYVPTWIVLSIALILIDAGMATRPDRGVLRDRWTRGVLLVASAAGSGLLAELFKLLVRRERPVVIDGHASYVFRAFSNGPLDASGLGMPSSHAAVAFGAAFMLCLLHPRASIVWLGLAIGCGATRVMTRAHFVSDVVAAGVLGLVVAWTLWRWHLANLARDQRRQGSNP
jgi:membrane-associated phospholipid phosphatase